MSFSTFSDAHPSIVVPAALTPRTFRKSRRLTAGGSSRSSRFPLPSSLLSVLIRLVVTRCAVVPGAEWRVRLSDVTVDAPAHVERGCLVDLLHVLNLPVTGLAGDARVDVTHVREVNVLGKLVDADPRHRLFLVPERGELLDFRLVAVGSSGNHGVASHAG